MCALLKPTLGVLRQLDYYEDPRFHLSLAWTLSTERDSSPFNEELLSALEEGHGLALREIKFDIDILEVCIGKKTSAWRLRASQE
jgi:hypothetical protein